MRKGYKVKRFSKNLYKTPKSGFRKVIEVLVSVVVVIGLGFIGFTAADALISLRCTDCERHRLFCLCEITVFVPAEPTSEPPTIDELPTIISEPTSEPHQLANINCTHSTVIAPLNVLSNSTALLAFIAEAKSDGFETVVIDMKNDFGHLLYQSGIILPNTSGDTLLSDNRNIVTGTLSADSIASAISAQGLNPVARITTLRGRAAPENIPDVRYAGWIDGERAWANPALNGTRTYISEIVRELHNAGFAGIMLAGNIFPSKPFSARDLHILPDYVSNFETRYTALEEFVNTVAGAVPDAVILLDANEGDEILRGYSGGQNNFGENVVVVKNFLQAIDN
jgi:hypothetical protein